MSAGRTRRQLPHGRIALYWAGKLPEKPLLDFPENPDRWIGLGEPYCFACGWLAPVPDIPTVVEGMSLSARARAELHHGLYWDVMVTWNNARHWLERCHLVDHARDGLDDVQNMVLLCSVCHTEMPPFGHGEGYRALLWVRDREDWMIRGQQKLIRMSPESLYEHGKHLAKQILSKQNEPPNPFSMSPHDIPEALRLIEAVEGKAPDGHLAPLARGLIEVWRKAEDQHQDQDKGEVA